MNALSSRRGAAFFMPLRRTGTPVKYSKLGPGSAAHHAAKGGALRCVRGTNLGQINFLTGISGCIASLRSS
jgi:hypothetical protein